MNYNGTEYYYMRNGQNDIVGLMDNAGAVVVSYSYDAWGKSLTVSGTLATTLGQDNPFRYRGYYYDTETGLYYLQTRYYDATVCRFISADVYMSTGQGIVGSNMYAYCLNNPVNMSDDYGCRASWNNAKKALIAVAIIAAIVVVAALVVITTIGTGGGALAFAGAAGGSFAAGTAATAAAITLKEALIAGSIAITSALTIQAGQNITYSKQAKEDGKSRSTDKPSWTNKGMVDSSKNAQFNATKMMNNKYGVGNWSKGAGSEFSKIVKWLTRSLGLK